MLFIGIENVECVYRYVEKFRGPGMSQEFAEAAGDCYKADGSDP